MLGSLLRVHCPAFLCLSSVSTRFSLAVPSAMGPSTSPRTSATSTSPSSSSTYYAVPTGATAISSVDTVRMIDEVHARPVIWDSTSDSYRDRAAKRDAWLDVCNGLYPQLCTYPEDTRNAILRKVMQRWRSVRDGYVRNLKALKQRDAGLETGRKMHRDYVYFHQLSFLSRLSDVKIESEDSGLWDSTSDCLIAGSHEYETVKDESMSDLRDAHNENSACDEDFCSEEETADAMDCVAVEMTQDVSPIKRPRNAMTAAALPLMIEPDDDWAFFSSLLPMVRPLEEDQKLEFRVQVLNALRKIKSDKRPVQSQIISEYSNND